MKMTDEESLLRKMGVELEPLDAGCCGMAGPFGFVARMETEKAPATCALFAKLLPFKNKVIHSRWSGEAVCSSMPQPRSQS